jgi:hypothetical protein
VNFEKPKLDSLLEKAQNAGAVLVYKPPQAPDYKAGFVFEQSTKRTELTSTNKVG